MPELTEVDVLIIGGGIYGAGIAQAAAAAGHSVLLVEQHTLASATSGNSTKLIHGGLRYLESMQFGLVYEALHERELLLQLAPELVSRQWFYIPVYRYNKRPAWMVKTGLALYWALSLGRSRFKSVPRSQWHSVIPGLNTDQMVALLAYEDGATDDAALTQAVAASAEKLGADIRQHSAFTRAKREEDHWLVQLSTTNLSASKSEPAANIRAKILINAAGPWINHVREQITPAPPDQGVQLVQGAHLHLDRTCHAFVYVESEDGRVMFFRPWQHGTLAGTTETDFNGDPADACATNEEVAAILATYNRYFPANPCTESDILKQYCGIRVLPQNKAGTFSASRETVLICDNESKPAYIGVYGGKLTTYRRESEKVARLIARRLPGHRKADSRRIKLMGAQINSLLCKLLICKESGNHTFRFSESKKAMDGLFTISSRIRQSGIDHATTGWNRAFHRVQSQFFE